MKKIIGLLWFMSLLSGCSWIHHKDDADSTRSSGWIGGPDAGPGRGTTGVGSGADSGRGITGSDAAPP
ncbi:MAG TPA: hypothetical protein VFE51_21610 [Verrucomicrobiae bacterium]|nr:hypothetical protein [Verrucomicrobiae bacterium]